MIATTDRPALNFQHSTPAEWRKARRRLEAFGRSHDLTADQAEEMAQAVLVRMLTADYSKRTPYDPQHPGGASIVVAAGWMIHHGKRYGVWALYHGNARRHGIRSATEPAPVRDLAPGWTDPARMAAEGEALAARMPRLAARARQDGTTPAGLALRACGWGWPDETGTVPSITDIGPGYTPPRGCPGLHSTDPRPAAAAAPVMAADPAAYRAALAEYYAGR